MFVIVKAIFVRVNFMFVKVNFTITKWLSTNSRFAPIGQVTCGRELSIDYILYTSPDCTTILMDRLSQLINLRIPIQ